MSSGKAGPPDDQTEAMIAEIWGRMRPIVRQRLDALEGAVTAAEAGTLTDPARADAESTAHKLAGSLGLYGFASGSERARSIERRLQTLEIGPDERGSTLHELIADLRSSLGA